MEPKKMLNNKSFCPLPWTGFIVNQNGDVKNCVLAKDVIGNVNTSTIQEVLANEKNMEIKRQMLSDQKPSNCAGCHRLEEGKNNFDIISQRVYYLKELKSVDRSLYDQIENFDLQTVDIRWTNQCNQACVYCGPHNSTLWEKEVGPTDMMTTQAKESVREFIFDHAHQLKNVYLAGGEPTLMNENIKFLQLLKEKNPRVHLRINTNLNSITTKVAKLVREFDNVHWIASVESTQEHYNYIRHGGNWDQFCRNLNEIRKNKAHKISFNMLHCLLNHLEIFNCIDFLKNIGFHNNSFVLGPVYRPEYLNILNLPDHKIKAVRHELKKRIADRPGFILEDGYVNLLRYLDTPFDKDLKESFAQLAILDKRRMTDSRKIFKELYD